MSVKYGVNTLVNVLGMKRVRQTRFQCAASMECTSPLPPPPPSDNTGPKKPKVLVLTGPTAVGKTAVSLQLAKRLGGEIISADSVQVYKGLDVGSDKIPVSQRMGIPHHLIDILDPSDEFSAGDFYHKARQATADILSRGKTPIVVGGTGFYLRWFILGKPSTPPATQKSEEAAHEALNDAWTALQRKLGRDLEDEERWGAGVEVVEKLGDIETAKRLKSEPNNYYRLIRVVDILLQSPGKTLEELNLNEAAPLDYDFRCYFLSRPREQLYRRIDARVEDMMLSGLMDEVRRELVVRGLEPDTNCATRAIGYRQALNFLKSPEKITEQRVIQLAKDIQTASRKLCHRQLSWFRDDTMFRWIDACRLSNDGVVNNIVELWNAPAHAGGCDLPHGRLTEEEKKAMKRYVTKMTKLLPGSDVVRELVEAAERATL